jgi:hypothetical protein
MNKLSTFGLALTVPALALALGGCGRSKTEKADDPGQATTTGAAVANAKAGAIKGSCSLRTTASSCSQETDKSDELGLAKGLCEAIKGTWADHAPCPEDHLVAKCEAKEGHVTSYYSDGALPYDADSAKEACNLPGDKLTLVAAPAKEGIAAKKGATAPKKK